MFYLSFLLSTTYFQIKIAIAQETVNSANFGNLTEINMFSDLTAYLI